jgi:hypothetical protein
MRLVMFNGLNTALAAGMAFALTLAGCASTTVGPDAGPRPSWLKLEQVEKRFAIFTNFPAAPKVGETATFRLVYVYMPETVQYEGADVGWQEYPEITVNCEADTARLGQRTRYAPDGSVMMTDTSQDFSPIYGPSLRKAADINCKGAVLPDAALISEGPDWIGKARQHISVTQP